MSALVSRLFSRSKQTTNKINDSTHFSTMSSDDSDEGQWKPQSLPLISHLYDEADEFEKVLLRSGCINGVCPPGKTGFADLVAHDLSKCERAVVDRDAQIRAVNKSWVSNPEDLETSLSNHEDAETTSSHSSDLSNLSIPAIHRASTEDSERLDKLEAEDIVSILVNEFGPLASPNDEERLFLEADGCLLDDVAIVGVIHLTTHRITFHASLLATRPDLASSQGVIKAGPAILHRKGWRTKRRVWLELYHDVVCAYASSKDEDRLHPLCTLLLTFVKNVRPVDPQHPRIMRLSVQAIAHSVNDYTEFDTEESAQDWRREVSGAVFTYRHLRNEFYASSPESNGVKLSCPLTRIMEHRPSQNSAFPSLASITLQLSPSDFQFENESIPASKVIDIGPVNSVPVWERLNDIVSEAKQRRRSQPSDFLSPVVVDFGPYNFFASEGGPCKPSSNLPLREEKAIRLALGFSCGSELWNISFQGAHISHHYMFRLFCDIPTPYWLLEIRYVKPFHLNWLNVEGITLRVIGKPDAKIIFKSTSTRNEVIRRINALLDNGQLSPASSTFSSPLGSPSDMETPDADRTLPASPKHDAVSIFAPLSRSLAAAVAAAIELPVSAQSRLPKLINLPRDILITRETLHFVCLTIGSRGDVQPYIALGLGLKKEGHTVTIVTHEEYQDWILGFGLNHRTAGGDPGALMKLSVENKMFSPEFFRQSLSNFRPWLDQLLLESWAACHDADVLLESPSAMAGVHIAEALNIPYFRTFTMPWTKTTEFPHAFLSPPVESPTFNSASYILFSNVIWAATSKQINKWRRQSLRISNTDMGHLAQSKITFIYNFSKAVVPKPLDWPDTTIISGYWFLDDPEHNWTPPQELLDFMAQARVDGKPIVYIGFGSITVPHPNRITARIVKAVLQSDVRAIISKGWSARMSKPDEKDPPVEIPPECFLMDQVPHDWLFPRIDAALHHGGAGTTGASLRAGIPTLIKPWFADQFFWASRVQILGAGLKISSTRVNDMAEALTKATRNEAMKAQAAFVGEQIRKEDGVHTTIHTIYTYLHRASQNRAGLDKS